MNNRYGVGYMAVNVFCNFRDHNGVPVACPLCCAVGVHHHRDVEIVCYGTRCQSEESQVAYGI